jgi:hypothetical protein
LSKVKDVLGIGEYGMGTGKYSTGLEDAIAAARDELDLHGSGAISNITDNLEVPYIDELSPDDPILKQQRQLNTELSKISPELGAGFGTIAGNVLSEAAKQGTGELLRRGTAEVSELTPEEQAASAERAAAKANQTTSTVGPKGAYSDIGDITRTGIANLVASTTPILLPARTIPSIVASELWDTAGGLTNAIGAYNAGAGIGPGMQLPENLQSVFNNARGFNVVDAGVGDAGTAATGATTASRLKDWATAPISGPGLLNTAAGALGSALIGSLAENKSEALGSSLGSAAGSLFAGALGGTPMMLGPAGALAGLIIGGMLAPKENPPLYNPITGRMVSQGQPGYAQLEAFHQPSSAAAEFSSRPLTPEQAIQAMSAAESGNLDWYNSAANPLGVSLPTPMSFEQLAKNLQDAGVDLSNVRPGFEQYATMPRGASGGTVQGYAAGGIASLPTYKAGGRFLRGGGDGMSDSIPAVIEGRNPQRAALADGEFVVPADVVSHIGNGSSEAGSRKLYAMMDKIRDARTGRKKQAPKINPDKFLPAGRR